MLLGAGLLGGPACHKGISAMNERTGAAAPERGVDKLRSLITLPANPTEVWFEHAELARVTSAAQRRPGAPPRISAAASRPWFPDAVKRAVRPYDDHSVAVRGDKFDAAPFAKSPFLSGYVVAVEGGEYLIVVLETN